MRDTLFFSKLRVFLAGWRLRVRRFRPSQWHRWQRAHRTSYQQRLETPFWLEPLESRVLLAADLTGVVGATTLIDPAVPTNAATATVQVLNQGNQRANATTQVAMYSSVDTVFDASDVLLGTANAAALNVGQSRTVTVNLSIPASLTPGAYNLLARVDATNVIAEGTAGEANNISSRATPFTVAWQFGNVPGRSGNTTLTLRDADGTSVTFRLTGPGLGEVISDGVNWDMKVTGTTTTSAVTIQTNSSGNARVTLNDIHVLGPLASLTAATTDLTGMLAIDGAVNIPGALPGTITLGSIAGGSVAVLSVEALTVLGSVTNANFYIGTTLGQDGQLGGTGANADTFGQGRIGLFTVTGAMTSSTVRVGINPTDGVFGNGNDTLIGGTASSIGGIIIGGALSADTRFIAGAFPTNYLLNLNLLPTAGDPHFVSSFEGPSLTAALQNDTGASGTDGLTNDPSITGSATDPNGIATFLAGFGATPTFTVLADRQPDGSFTFTQTRLEQINGGALADGPHILTLRATDTLGNATQTSVSFVLDQTSPASLTFDLAPASDSPPVGDQQTIQDTVTLAGQTEADALVELVGLGRTTTADAAGTFSFSNVALTLGANVFTARATDAAGNQRVQARTITRVASNTSPVLGAIGPQTVDEGQLLSFTATASDGDLPAQPLTFSLANGVSGAVPAGAAIDPTSGLFTWTPTEAQGPGSYTFDVVVSDGSLTDSETLTVTVGDVNQAPVLTPIGAQTVDEGQLLSFTATASDGDLPAQPLTFSLENWVSGTTGTALRIVPASPLTGPAIVKPGYTAPQGTAVPFDTSRDLAFQGNGFAQPAVALNQLDLPPIHQVQFANDGFYGNGSSWISNSSNSWVKIDLGRTVLVDQVMFGRDRNGGFNDRDPGQFSIGVALTDDAYANGNANNDLTEYTTVFSSSALGYSGVINGPETVQAAFTPVLARYIKLNVQNGGAAIDEVQVFGPTIDPTTGVFTWAPSEVQGPGTFTFDVVVTDNGTPNLSDRETVTVTVNEVNLAPQLSSIGAQTVNEGQTLTFTATGTDEDLSGHVLSYSLQGTVPAGASIDPDTGEFSWTPTTGQIGEHSITVRVTDNGTPAMFAEETLTVTVGDVNQAPVLTPIGAKTVDEGQLLSFTATASDADLPANALIYSLQGTVPVGASIDPNAGAFTWTPTAGQIGPHTVTVRVTDNGSPALFDEETITITVNAVNATPTATNDDYTVQQDSTLIAGTLLVKDILAGTGASNASNFTNVNGTVFFSASDGVNGTELWKSDGTAVGTSMVKDIRPGSNSGSVISNVTIANVNGILFFAGNDGVNGTELWRSDGTAVGTFMVKDIRPGSSSIPANMINVGGTLFFTANDGVHGVELWKSDGTEAGTVLVHEIRSGAADSFSFASAQMADMNGTLFFSAGDSVSGTELWKSDGTAAGTVLVKDIFVGTAGSGPVNLTNVNGTLFFVANDGVTGFELWKSDGTAAGTLLVKDIWAGAENSGIQNLTNVNGTLFFQADDSVNGGELWKSDGTVAGTVLVKDISPGIVASGLNNLTNVNGTLFFRAFVDVVSGGELWRSDGTTVGTVLVKDIFPGSGSSNPNSLTNVNGTLFFAATDGTANTELWKSDGTTLGTVLVKDINPGGRSSGPVFLTSVNGTLFFRATSLVSGTELWASGLQNSLLANDNDPDSPTLTAMLGTGPSNGSLALNSDGTFTYRPNVGFMGTDTFTYTVSDGTSTSNLATVTITVTA